MADASPSFPDRAAQLIADFQHAMDSNAPLSIVLMNELKDLLKVGVSACAARDHAAVVQKDMQAEVAELMTSVGQISA